MGKLPVGTSGPIVDHSTDFLNDVMEMNRPKLFHISSSSLSSHSEVLRWGKALLEINKKMLFNCPLKMEWADRDSDVMRKAENDKRNERLAE